MCAVPSERERDESRERERAIHAQFILWIDVIRSRKGVGNDGEGEGEMQQGTAREQRGGWGGRGQKKRNKSKEKQTRNEREIKTIAAAAASYRAIVAVAVYSSGLCASPLAPVVVDVDVFTAQLLKQPRRESFSIFGAPASSRLCNIERKMISFLSFFFSSSYIYML